MNSAPSTPRLANRSMLYTRYSPTTSMRSAPDLSTKSVITRQKSIRLLQPVKLPGDGGTDKSPPVRNSEAELELEMASLAIEGDLNQPEGLGIFLSVFSLPEDWRV